MNGLRELFAWIAGLLGLLFVLFGVIEMIRGGVFVAVVFFAIAYGLFRIAKRSSGRVNNG